MARTNEPCVSSFIYFCCKHNYCKKIAKLSDQEVGRLFRALITYSATGETQELTGRESIAFDFIAADIDEAKKLHEELCRMNSEKGKRGGRPKKQRMMEKTIASSENVGFSEKAEKAVALQETKEIPPTPPKEKKRIPL